MKKIILATRNEHKIKEIINILAEDKFIIYSLRTERFSSIPEISENGKTFEENARKKAREVFAQTGILTLADDSGLVVEALNGAPGVRSARYAGEGATHEDLCKKLLNEMESVEENKRKAKFVCCVVICFPDGCEKVVRGETGGIITKEMKGKKGFGYDPVFYYPPENKTFAELSMEEKNKVSHRYKAFSKAKEILLNLA